MGKNTTSEGNQILGNLVPISWQNNVLFAFYNLNDRYGDKEQKGKSGPVAVGLKNVLVSPCSPALRGLVASGCGWAPVTKKGVLQNSSW